MIDIAVRDLKKEYEVGQPVLDGLTFQVDTGERVGILGRNGRKDHPFPYPHRPGGSRQRRGDPLPGQTPGG